MRMLVVILVAAALACAAGAPHPAALDTKNEPCRFCRMTISDPHFASQIVAPGEEPTFFDDLGCLAKYLEKNDSAGGTTFVADHRDGSWTPAATAVYSKCAAIETPMGSRVIAHRDDASRRSDRAGMNCKRTTLADLRAK